ncbi:MAG: 5-formyltetrahydrofolate cyclo-ligase [Carboxylicivirga sp.]|jgi:5-formyltetrahydrofolate cyclo-ligase|nr:5-formyltetrahydrofolate cyclo-ligase [Carboxylicivirga sp.]
MIEKKALRQKIRELKKQLNATERMRQSDHIQLQLEQRIEFIKARKILLYWAISDEVPTQGIINSWYQEKEIYLPVIHNKDLKIVKYEGEQSMVPDEKYGIPEPTGEEVNDETLIDLVIVPGVAFDKQNNRMGRGAGYYDRILNRLVHASKIGLAFDIQMVEQVPVEAHDIKMDMVIYPI